jgi:hypothetical protein
MSNYDAFSWQAPSQSNLYPNAFEWQLMNKRGRPSIGHGTFSQLQALLNTDEKKLRGIMGTAEHGGRLRRMNHGAFGSEPTYELDLYYANDMLRQFGHQGGFR